VSHMVIFRTPEGKPGYQPAETVQDAVEVVERLRNDEGVENVRIFRLEEVQFEYRPYYKVEIAGAGADTDPAPPQVEIVGGRTDEVPSDDVEFEEPTDIVDVVEPSTEVSGGEVPPPPSAEHPPWAAPPPPPPGPVIDQPPSGEGQDDELSGAGQRRGLFGR
jgi:hypothetical protein